MFVFGNLVSWKSKKQNAITKSNAEAEFRTIAQRICEEIMVKETIDKTSNFQ